MQRTVGYLYVFLISRTLTLFMQETCTHLLYMHCELIGWRVPCTCSDLLYTPPQLQVTSCMQPLRRYGKYVCIYIHTGDYIRMSTNLVWWQISIYVYTNLYKCMNVHVYQCIPCMHTYQFPAAKHSSCHVSGVWVLVYTELNITLHVHMGS